MAAPRALRASRRGQARKAAEQESKMPPNLPLGRDGEGRLGGEASRNRGTLPERASRP